MASILVQLRLQGRFVMGEFRLLPGSRPLHAALPALCLALALPCAAQSLSSPQQTGHMGDRMGRATDELEPAFSPDEQKRQRLLNIERQKSMVSDADKLLKLARQFNAEMLAASPGSLTPAQLRTLNEMEKLARSVKSKMSNPVRLTPALKEVSPFP